MQQDANNAQIGPWQLLHLARADRWFAESEAFAGAARRQFAEIAEGRAPREWPTFKVAGYTFAHSLELFLKSGLILASQSFKPDHKLPHLYARFREAFPASAFPFVCPVESFIEEHRGNPFHIFLRYPEELEKLNQSWDAGMVVDPAAWLHNVTMFMVDIGTLWSLMKQRYP